MYAARTDICNHSYATSDCSFSIVERVPCKTDARFKILQRGIVEEGVTKVGCGVCDVPQVGELTVGLCQHGVHLITQTQIKRQAGSKSPIILHVNPKQSCAKIAW